MFTIVSVVICKPEHFGWRAKQNHSSLVTGDKNTNI